MNRWFCAFHISAFLCGYAQQPPSSAPASANQSLGPVQTLSAVLPKAQTVYVLNSVPSLGSSLIMMDSEGRETCIDRVPSKYNIDAANAKLPDAFGPFAPAADGESVFFVKCRPRNQKSTSVATAVGTVLGGALGGAIAGSIASEGESGICYTFSIWDRSTGKVELLWDIREIETVEKGWGNQKEYEWMGKKKFYKELLSSPNATYIFPLKDRNFLVSTPSCVIRMDARNHKVTPVWIDALEKPSEGNLVWQSAKGHLRFIQPLRIICVEPDEQIHLVEGLWTHPVAFLGPNEFLTGDGKQIQRFRIQGSEAKLVNAIKMKHTRLIGREGTQHFYSYQYSGSGATRISKVSLEGKVFWTFEMGACKEGIALGEAEGNVWVMLQPSGMGSSTVYKLDALTGVIQGQDAGAAESTLSVRRRHLDIDVAKYWPEVLSSRRLDWFSAASEVDQEGGGWAVLDNSSSKLISQHGFWAWVNPDLSVEPVAARPRAEHLAILSAPQPVRFENGISTQRISRSPVDGPAEVPAP